MFLVTAGGCDLVLLRNPNFLHGLGMDIHIRTKITDWWSYIETAVIKIGSATLEVTGGIDGGRYWLNGQPGDELVDGATFDLNGFEVKFTQVTSEKKKYRIDFGTGDGLKIGTFKDFVDVNMLAKNADNFRDSVGLMGEATITRF